MSEVSAVRNLASITDEVLRHAMDYCAEKVQLEGSQGVLDRLREGDGEVSSYCHYSVAQQVAESLGALDDNVKAAYIYDYDAGPDEFPCEQSGNALPIHLILWTDRKTAALNAVVETWDRALTQRYAEIVGVRQPTHLLDVQVVDCADVEKRMGYGAMLTSLHHRPIQVWQR
jgi:hypothetical protein